jgi:rare lipoprotein A
MRAFFAAVLTALAIAGGAALPAEAASIGDLRTVGAHKAAPLALLARATFDDDDEVRPPRRGRADARYWKRPGYARQRYSTQRSSKQRSIKHSKRTWSSISKRSGKDRRVVTGRPSRKAVRHAPRPVRIPVKAYPIARLPIGSDILGLASYYWQGQRTATGEWFNPNGMTAAHRTLPFGTKVRVTHLGSGRSVVVRINDRGPYIAGRIIDLSKGAAGLLGMHQQGVARVKVTVLSR